MPQSDVVGPRRVGCHPTDRREEEAASYGLAPVARTDGIEEVDGEAEGAVSEIEINPDLVAHCFTRSENRIGLVSALGDHAYLPVQARDSTGSRELLKYERSGCELPLRCVKPHHPILEPDLDRARRNKRIEVVEIGDGQAHDLHYTRL